jgi:hypothetical protein
MERKMTKPAAAPLKQASPSITVTPPLIGTAWPSQGGIYAGILRGEVGAPDFHLIIASDPAGAIDAITWGGRNKDEPGAKSNLDGLTNTASLCQSKTDHPAAQWAAAISIDGHSDFYLPARHELRLAYLNTPELFATDDWYWSSTQHASHSDYAWHQHFGNGYQDNDGKSFEGRARAVRRLAI